MTTLYNPVRSRKDKSALCCGANNSATTPSTHAICRLAVDARRGRTGFTLIETLIASAIVTTSAVALYGSILFGVQQISIAREERRSTQILVEMTEALRLYTWEQLHDATFVPATFTAVYDPLNPSRPGVTYAGSVTVTDYTGTENYASTMARVGIALVWTNANVPRKREITTLVTQLGLQNYVY